MTTDQLWTCIVTAPGADSPLPEIGWFDAKGPQVDVTLTAMVNLIIDHIEEGIDILSRIPAKCDDLFLEPIWSDVGPVMIDLIRRLIPLPK